MLQQRNNTYLCKVDYSPTQNIMRKLFFSVIALTVGALTFTSCEKDDVEEEKKEEQKENHLAIVDQQDIFTNTIDGIAESIEFTNLAQLAEIVVQEMGYPINFDGAIDAMGAQDPILGRKIEGLKNVLESDQLSFDFESLYFEASIAFYDTILYDTTRYWSGDGKYDEKIEQYEAYVPYLVSVNHDADRFLINIRAVDDHLYTLSLKGSNDTESRVTYVTADMTSSITLPNSLEFSLSFDQIPVLSMGGSYNTDFRIVAESAYDPEENDTVLTSLTIEGQNFKGKGQFVLDKYTISATAEYSAQSGLKTDGSLVVGGVPVLTVTANLDATLDKYINWAETSSVMGWAMNYNAVRAFDITAALGGDQIKFVLGLKENPVQYSEIMNPVLSFAAGSQPEPDAIQAMVDKFNELFTGEIYFKGYDKPQAVIKLAYADPSVAYGTKGAGEDTSILNEMLGNLLSSGLYIEVATYDTDGNEITVPIQEYFGKIDLSKPVQKVVANFNAAFGPLLSMFSDENVDDEWGYIE